MKGAGRVTRRRSDDKDVGKSRKSRAGQTSEKKVTRKGTEKSRTVKMKNRREKIPRKSYMEYWSLGKNEEREERKGMTDNKP